MIKNLRKAIIVVAVLATLTTGCRSTEEYERLANAGRAYTIAVDELLEAKAKLRIDNTSEDLLFLDRQRPLTSEDYRDLSTNDSKQLEILTRIRQHNHLLSDYFRLLYQLADSNAPTSAQGNIQNIVTNLGAVSQQLQPLVTQSETLGEVTRLVVSGKIRGALRDELEQRKDIIQAEFVLQQQLLDLLAEQIENNLKNIQSRQEERLVIQPLTEKEPIGDPDGWITTRQSILTMEQTAKELRAASDAARDFQAVFEDFVTGKLNAKRINIFLTDIESLLGVIESVKN